MNLVEERCGHMTDACGVWGLGRPEDEQSTYRALLSIRNSCVTVAGIQVCGQAASQDLVSDFKAVSACCVLRRMTVCRTRRGGDAPARALRSLGSGAACRVCGPTVNRPDETMLPHQTSNQKRCSFTPTCRQYIVPMIRRTSSASSSVTGEVGPTRRGSARACRGAPSRRACAFLA